MALDFIIKLLKSKELLIDIEYDFILVKVDELTKYIYFKLYKEKSIVENLVYIFIKIVIIRYRTLEIIKLDRELVFTSIF